MTSKFICKRCREMVDVISPNSEYVNDGGDLYCGKFCHSNKYIPLDPSRKFIEKKKRKSHVVLMVAENYHMVSELRQEYGWRKDNMELVILSITGLKYSPVMFKDFDSKFIKSVENPRNLYLSKYEEDVLDKLVKYSKKGIL